MSGSGGSEKSSSTSLTSILRKFRFQKKPTYSQPSDALSQSSSHSSGQPGRSADEFVSQHVLKKKKMHSDPCIKYEEDIFKKEECLKKMLNSVPGIDIMEANDILETYEWDFNKYIRTLKKEMEFQVLCGPGENECLPEMKEVVESKKKSTKLVKVIRTAPNKRQILNSGKSRTKRIYKTKPLKRNPLSDKFPVSNREGMSDDVTSKKTNSLSNITYGFMGLNDLGRAILFKFVQSGLEIFLWEPFMMDAVMKCVKNMKEIKQADSPAELIKNCDVTFCCYASDSNEFKAIVYGENNILEGFDEAEKLGRKPGYVQLSYIDRKSSEAIDEAAKAKNGMYLEAPIYESCEGVKTCEGIINASGDINLFTKCEKCFGLIASNCFFQGCEIGLSSNTTMLLNAVTGTIDGAISETMVLFDRLSIDIDEDDLSLILRTVLDNNPIMERVEEMGIPNTKTVVPIKNVQECINLASMEADKLNQRTPMTSAANELYKHAKRLNYSNEDVSNIYEVLKTFSLRP